MEQLKLERPLAVFDIESTGIMPQRDRIVEIAVLKIFPDGRSQNTVRRLNPEMPIPPGATAVHGITDADVADCPTFLLIAENSTATFRTATWPDTTSPDSTFPCWKRNSGGRDLSSR